VGNWLTERFTLFGATFPNWMTVALVIVLIGVLIALWRQLD
jgi:cell division protein FtsX